VKAIDLTPEEQTNVRTALRFLRARCGGWASLAKVLRFGESTLGNVANGHAAVGPVVAFRVARLAKVGVDDVLTGRFPAPGTCPHCGHYEALAAAE
jgi:hypothetical protein